MSNLVYAFRFQPELCIQCHACETACKTWRSPEPGLSYRQFISRFQGSYPTPRLVPTTISCLHCSTPDCVDICPAGAITVEEYGIVRINSNSCVGCRLCRTSCMLRAPRFNRNCVMHKCDMCGGDPLCARACPTQALTCVLVTPEEKDALNRQAMAQYIGR